MLKQINKQIRREQMCFEDLQTISKVYLEHKEWEKLDSTLLDMNKTVRTIRQLDERKNLYLHENQLKRCNALVKVVLLIIQTFKNISKN